MRAYSERKDFQQSYPRQKGKVDDFSLNREEARRMNGPKSTHSPCKKYISVVSEGNYFIASKAPLPDRIELRMCGTSGNLGQSKRSLSIPDLYRVKMKPIPEVVEETVDAVRREDVRAEGPRLIDECVYSPNDGSMKEPQYKPYFDPSAPRFRAGGWKVDMERNGIPHHRPQISTLYNPIDYEARRKPERPKSAPPTFPHEEDIFSDGNDDDRLSSSTLPTLHQNYPESVRSNDELTSRLRELWIDPPTPEYINDDRSSIDPGSDDTSETSSAFNSSGKRDPAKFSYSRPKLIRLSADFPGVRNLEKMRRKRQSMGSSSTGSMSSPSLSPSVGEYGFFVALTSKDKAPLTRNGRHYSMT